MYKRKFFKVVGLQIDALEVKIVSEVNRKTIMDAASYADLHHTEGTIWILLPCYCN